MKKQWLVQCVYCFLSILNIDVGMAWPEQVSMHIYGNVVDEGGDVATKSALQNIHIGDCNISDFQSANTVSTAADLHIDITGCAAGITGADVLFSGEADTLAPTLLKLSATGDSGGMATRIAVQILDAQSQHTVPLNSAQPLTPLKAGDNPLKYQLRYKSNKEVG
ncbi:fimbrial protein, partial [Escherichia coli]|uniref:fimbrial protein n=1 Tax=Escherichia coli TaxID=562 RepID=UPI001083AEF8